MLLLYISATMSAQQRGPGIVPTPLPQPTNWALGQLGVVPFDAIVGGHEADGTPLYVCRGGQKEGYNVQPGKFRSGWTGCDIGFGGVETNVSDFEVLVSSWQDTSGGYIPPNAIQGGYDGFTGHFGELFPWYFCRAQISGTWYQLGKIGSDSGACLIPYGGGQYQATQYQVLVQPYPLLPLNMVIGQNGYVPPDAIRGGTDNDGSPLYLCSGEYAPNGTLAGLYPGKLRSDFGGCDISVDSLVASSTSNAVEVVTPQYKVLVPVWSSNSNLAIGQTLSFGFPAGTDVDGIPLYVCRDYFEGGLQPGKTKQVWNVCNFGWSGKELSDGKYDVLSTYNAVAKPPR